MRQLRPVTKPLLIVLLAATATIGAPAPGPGRFEFVVLRPTSSEIERVESVTSASFDSVGVLFTLADIENWSRGTGEIRLTAPAAERVAGMAWWNRIATKAGWHRFEFRVDSVPICAGRLWSLASSSLPPPGLLIQMPFIGFRDDRTIHFGFHRGSYSAHLVDEPSPRCQDDARLLAVLREAGVLSE